MNTRPEAQEAGGDAPSTLCPSPELFELLRAAKDLCEYGHGDNVMRDRLRKAGKAFDSARKNLSALSLPAGDAAECDVEYQFEVWQDGEYQAGGSAMTAHECGAEAAHYAAMYGQDAPQFAGPVEVRFYQRRQIKDTALQPGQGKQS